MAPKKRNTNARTHGLYARHYTEAERKALQQMSPMESEHEIHMLRATIDRILSMIETCDDEDRKVKLYNALFLGTQRLSNAMRTQSLLVGDNKELLTSFWEAVELFRREHKL
jgi:hypothetical protein